MLPCHFNIFVHLCLQIPCVIIVIDGWYVELHTGECPKTLTPLKKKSSNLMQERTSPTLIEVLSQNNGEDEKYAPKYRI